MDLRLSQQDLNFRDGMRAFFKAALPPAIRAKMQAGDHLAKADMVAWNQILHARGWSVPHWPVEWGGPGWTPVQQYLFGDEMQLAGAPQILPFGAGMVGPVIMTFGSEAQKRRHLPRIASLEDWWCQGFSEPGAGSDLASLKTTARREGDCLVVNGQKTWTTLAQFADWIFCLVRTDPDSAKPGGKRQEGISFLLIDMKTPGIAVRPIQTIDGGVEINEVFFDDVRVPAANLVGKENKGWDYAKFLLGNERSGIARIGASKERLRRVRAFAAATPEGAGSFLDNRRFAEKLAAAEVELKALEITQWRVLANEAKNAHGRPDPASSILKLKGSELQQATTELMLEVAGPFALPCAQDMPEGHNQPPVGPDWASAVAPHYFNMRKVSIYGGSNEIQKSIIAKAILGL